MSARAGASEQPSHFSAEAAAGTPAGPLMAGNGRAVSGAQDDSPYLRLTLSLHRSGASQSYLDTRLSYQRLVSSLLLVGALVWLVVVGLNGSWLAIESILQFGTGKGADLTLTGEAREYFAQTAMLWAAAFIFATCLAVALVARFVRPTATVPVLVATGGLLLLVAAVLTGALVAVIAMLAIVLLAAVIGNAILYRLPLSPNVVVVRLPLVLGIGLGVVGLTLFALALPGKLNAGTVAASAGVAVLLIVERDRQRLGSFASSLRAWRPEAPSWFETVILAVVLGTVTFVTLSAFVPENQNDAFRHHLPIAREIWQTGAIPEFPPMGTSREPIQGHLLYAVAYGIGGMTAAKLLQAAVGLTALVAAAGIGWLCAGRLAAVLVSGLFVAVPVLSWEFGHAFPDLFAVMFTMASILCIVLWQRGGLAVWLVAAGALAGLGFAAKLTLGWVVIALAAGIFLVGRGPWRWRERFLAVIAFGLGTMVFLPWLARSYTITGTALPGLSILTNHLANVLPGGGDTAAALAANAVVDNAGSRGLVDRFFDVVRTPWHLTFHADEYPVSVTGGGDIGIALLMLVPLAWLGPRTRTMAFLFISMVVSFIGWSFTHQIVRHLLPTLAIAAIIAGVTVANVMQSPATRVARGLKFALPTSVIVALVAGPLILLSAERARLPVDFIMGRESAAAYVTRELPHTELLATVDTKVPPDAPVWYVGKRGGAQLYAEARLAYIDHFQSAPIDELVGATPEGILAHRSQAGVDYLIWDRPQTFAEDWRSTLVSTEFLSKHTRIFASDNGGYLFEFVTEGDQAWGTDSRGNRLADSRMRTVEKGIGPWKTSGEVNRKKNGTKLRPGSSATQRVPASRDSSYLLLVNGSCSGARDRLDLTLNWFDDSGVMFDSTTDSVIPGKERNDQFLWRQSPDGAASVSVTLATPPKSKCTFSNVALYVSPREDGPG